MHFNIKVLYIFIMVILSASCSDDLNDDSIIDGEEDFYPLDAGNIWVYEVTVDFSALSDNPGDSDTLKYYEKYKIVESKEWEKMKVFRFVEETFFPDTVYDDYSEAHTVPHYMLWDNDNWQGIKFPSRKFYFDEHNESFYSTHFNFGMDLNDEEKTENVYSYGTSVKVIEMGIDSFYGQNRNYKKFFTQAAYHLNEKKYVSGIGLYSGTFNEETNYKSGSFTLKGCVIDNTIYGDTSTVF